MARVMNDVGGRSDEDVGGDDNNDIYLSTNMYSSTAGTDFGSFCAPIDVPNNDPFFGGRKSCMNLVRFLNILKQSKLNRVTCQEYVALCTVKSWKIF